MPVGSVVPVERKLMISATEKIMSAVLLSCTTSPFNVVEMRRSGERSIGTNQALDPEY